MTPTFLLAVLVKGLLILGVALGVTLLFRRASAALRHGVWAAAFVALLLLPVLEAVGPKWDVPVWSAPAPVEGVLATLAPPAPPVPPAIVPPAPPAPPVPPAPPAPPVPPALGLDALDRHAAQMERHARRLERHAERMEARAEREAARAERQVEREVARLEREIERAHATQEHHVVVRTQSTAPVLLTSSPSGSIVQTIRSVPREVVLAMLWFWGIGALAVALFWGTAYAAAARAVRLGVPDEDDDRLAAWERARLLSGITRPVRLLRSPALDVPVAWGWGDAAVVLPTSADDWDDDRLEAVLLHELAHIARGDAFSQGVAQVALVLHWANPLAWLAYRHFLVEREHACDDVVLEHGARPSAYADHLVQVARDLRRRSAALAAFAPMARRSHLEGRVLSILDPSTKRSTLGRAASASLSVLIVAVVLSLTAVRPVAATAPETPQPESRVVNTAPDSPVRLDDDAVDLPEIPDTVELPDLGMAADDPDLDVAPDDVAMSAITVEAPRVADNVALALDTIPTFDEVIRPALEAALEAVRAMRDSERHQQMGLSDADWEDMEGDIRDAIEDARDDYDEAIADAIEEAMDEVDEERWTVSWMGTADGASVVARQHAERHARQAALADVRRDLVRAQEDARRAMITAQRDVRAQVRAAQREVQAAQRAQARARATARVQGQPGSYAYSFSADGQTLSVAEGAAAWVLGLDNLDRGLDGIERALAELDASSPGHEARKAGIESSLSGIQTGLRSIRQSADAWAQSRTERQIARERLATTKARIAQLRKQLDTCEE